MQGGAARVCRGGRRFGQGLQGGGGSGPRRCVKGTGAKHVAVGLAGAGELGAAHAEAAGVGRGGRDLRVPPHQAQRAGGVGAGQGHAAVRQGRRQGRAAGPGARPGHRFGRDASRASVPTVPATTARRPTWPTRRRSSARSSTSRSRCWIARRSRSSAWARSWRWRRARPSRCASSSPSTTARPRARRRWCWWARASPSTPAASRIKPAAEMDEMKFDMGGAASVLGTLRAVCRAQAQAEPGVHHPVVREHAQQHGGQARRRGDQHVGPDDRDPEHRRRRAADPVRRADLCRALQARRRGRRGHAHGRLRDCAGPPPLRPVHRRRQGGRADAERQPRRARPVLAHAARRRVRRSAEEQLRRHGQRGRPCGRSDHGGDVPEALHGQVPMGPPGHRRHGLEVRHRQGFDRSTRAAC